MPLQAHIGAIELSLQSKRTQEKVAMERELYSPYMGL
jgi:hypothetical protein